METTSIIDAHQHFWNYTPAEYDWIDDSMAALKRDFRPSDLYVEMQTCGVAGSIAVQARQTLEETTWLLDLAAENDFLNGVVGWAPIAAPNFEQLLEELVGIPKLKGLRHVVQGEADGFLARADFNAGIAALRPAGLVYDILILERQLPQAIEFVDRHPNQIFILDHIAKPLIARSELTPWANRLIELGRRANVYCKLSGMVTEANWQSWTAVDLRPYIDAALEAFTPKRLLAGSDWPVCTVASGYREWFAALAEVLAPLTVAERQRIFSGTAVEAYRLPGNTKELL